jgi:hypothetical protein
VSDPLIVRVTSLLDLAGVRYALIGAGALAVHGVVRSTFDLDLLTTSASVLEPDAWNALAADAGVRVDRRRGDADDPLAGVVRIGVANERDIDLVVGRWAWQTEAVERARPVLVFGVHLPVVDAADLVLLKLYAGGLQDRWDIDQLLTGAVRHEIVAEVESRLDRLPVEARDLWALTIGATR